MKPISIRYLSGHDVAALALDNDEILLAIEGSLRAQGNAETVIEPRMHLVPNQSVDGHFNVLRGYIAPGNTAGVKIVGDHIVGLFNTQEPVEPQLESMRATGAEAVLVLSAYGALAPVQAAISRMRASDQGNVEQATWKPVCYQNLSWVAMTAFGKINTLMTIIYMRITLHMITSCRNQIC